MTKDEFIDKHEKDRPFVEWCTGGASGGSCWGDEAHSFSGDEEPDFGDELMNFLYIFVDEVSDIEFENIRYAPGLAIERSWTDNEYYGNYYERSSKTIDMEVIWPFIELIIDVPDASVRKAHYILMED